ncbi:hypothetical protein DXG01_000571 [Tephrocybe rancida]|nr:hypothetical protein DXG01_000571 [Tephrocybe rancida]
MNIASYPLKQRLSTIEDRPTGHLDEPADVNGRKESIDFIINERLADEIQEEFWFRLSRLPSKITHTVRIVPLILIFLWILLVISNIYGPFGYWETFITISTAYRERFKRTRLAQGTGLDSPDLDGYSLWRGVVVISVMASLTYIMWVVHNSTFSFKSPHN